MSIYHWSDAELANKGLVKLPDGSYGKLPKKATPPTKKGRKTREENTNLIIKQKYKYLEYDLHCKVCEYLRTNHPDILFDSDTIASVKLTKPQAARNKKIQKEGFKRPDIVIYKTNYIYGGLFIELKKESPYLKDGKTLSNNEHIQAQAKTMQDLKVKGYAASFAWSLEMAIDIIENYLKII